jgi:Kelch motif
MRLRAAPLVSFVALTAGAGCPLEPFPVPDVTAVPACTTDADCDAGNPCVVAVCSEDTCSRTLVDAGTSCSSDGNLCDGLSTCDGAGHCQPGTPVDVNDSDPCTPGSCDPTTGIVTYTATPECTTPLPSTGVPSPRSLHTAVWTGSAMIVWGGLVSGTPSVTQTGGLFDPMSGVWSATTTTAAPPPRHSHCAVWTGSKMIVWGGYGATSYETTGGVYDPAADAWTAMSTTGAPSGRTGLACVWTGSALLVWGGSAGATPTNTGGSYDPVADAWTALPTTGAPSPRFDHSAVWTGAQMIVWGGNDFSNWHADGASYDPAAGTWTATPTTGAPVPRQGHLGLWAGSQMIVWGGFDGGNYRDDGGLLDPKAGTWTAMSTTGAPEGRTEHTGVWTGTQMIVWGGCGTDSCATLYGDGGTWTPDTSGGTWALIPAIASVPPVRDLASVWTGTTALVWGGNAGNDPTDTGAFLTP